MRCSPGTPSTGDAIHGATDGGGAHLEGERSSPRHLQASEGELTWAQQFQICMWKCRNESGEIRDKVKVMAVE